MKKIIKILLLIFFISVFIVPVNAKEKDKITLYLFHGDGCPHCAEEIKYLDKLNYDIEIVKYEVWNNKENSLFMDKVKEKFNISENGIPLTIIGDSYILGYNDLLSSKINRMIEFYLENDYIDQIERIKNDEFVKEDLVDEFSKSEKNSDQNLSITVPLLGKLNLKKVSISTAAVLIGLIDGFNPCAMWVLLFLISVLIGMKNKKRMLVLGITFLTTSALVYMLIMFSWLNIVVHVSTSILFQKIIGTVGIIGGLINLHSYFKSNDSGCNVVDKNKRKKIFASIKKFTSEKSFILAILGVVALAVSVNIIELACSAGLPLIFTQLLAINNISGFSGFLYTLLYILFFLIDDIIIFLIAVFTMNATGISTKYNKYSHLIGGLLMLIIGLILIIKPEILMFNL